MRINARRERKGRQIDLSQLNEEALIGLHQLPMERLVGQVHKGSQIFSLDIWEKVVHLPVEESGRKIFPFGVF